MTDILTRQRPEATDGDDASIVVAGNDSNGNIRHIPDEQPTTAMPRATARESQVVLRRPRKWRVVVPVLLALTTLLGAIYFLASPAKSISTATVRRGSIVSSVETTGKLEAQKSAKLSFRASGRVEKVLVSRGDMVKAGQVLAELDTDILQRGLSAAEQQLGISRLKMQQAKEGAGPQEIAAAQANLNAAMSALNELKAGAATEDVAAAQSALNQAQATLDGLKKGASPPEITGGQARLNGAKANRDLVAATAANATEQARILYVQAGSATKNFLDPAGQLEQARLNYEAAKKSEAAQLAGADAKIGEAQAALDAIKAGPSKEEIQAAQEAVNEAAARLGKVKKGPTENEIAVAQSKVDTAQAALDKLKAGPTDTELAILQGAIKLSQIDVDKAQAQVNDARVISPLAGTVLDLDIQVGEIVNGSQPVATVADANSLRIQADVDEIDVGRVTPGQAVTVTLDAYPGVKLPGKIEALAPGATLKQGSTVYQATIAFTPTADVTPREGMAANVDITAQRKDNVLLLPNRAIETIGSRQYVTVKQGDTTSKIEVETGLSNNTDTEIISGLTESQTVMLK